MEQTPRQMGDTDSFTVDASDDDESGGLVSGQRTEEASTAALVFWHNADL